MDPSLPDDRLEPDDADQRLVLRVQVQRLVIQVHVVRRDEHGLQTAVQDHLHEHLERAHASRTVHVHVPLVYLHVRGLDDPAARRYEADARERGLASGVRRDVALFTGYLDLPLLDAHLLHGAALVFLVLLGQDEVGQLVPDAELLQRREQRHLKLQL